MRHRNTASNVIPINACENTENWAMVPVNISDTKIKFGMVEIRKRRGKCSFAKGIPVILMDFIYRAVVKLGLKDTKLIFARGSIKHKNRPLRRGCFVKELDWDAGTAIILPRTLTLKAVIRTHTEGDVAPVRWIEIAALQGLLQASRPGRKRSWYAAQAESIITRGWKQFFADENPGAP